MRIGVPQEIKNHEYRVGLTPASVSVLVQRGHEVWVQQQAGQAIGFSDDDYRLAGAQLAVDADTVFEQAELIVKVKEPQVQEYGLIKAHHTLFTYLHLAPDVNLTAALLKSGCVAIAYETVTDAQGRLPLLAPMSEIAGRLAVQAGAHCLEMASGGRGVLLAGAPGVPSADVLILGAGVVGRNATAIAVGMGAKVTVVDTNVHALRELDHYYGNRVQTRLSNAVVLDELLPRSDLVIGAVLLPGASAPKLVHRDHLARMRQGAVIVDVAIDQGGCVESARPTSHSEPTYVEQGIVHYCVSNMPGAVARTSTLALNNATLPYVQHLADAGVAQALQENLGLQAGLNLARGEITHALVAQSQGVRAVATVPLSLAGGNG